MSCRRRRLHSSRRAAMAEHTAGPGPRALSCMLAPYHSRAAKNQTSLGLQDVRRFPALPGVRTTLCEIEELCTTNYATLPTHHRARYTPHKTIVYLSSLLVVV